MTKIKDLRAKGKYAPVQISNAQQKDESNIIKGLSPTKKSSKHRYTKQKRETKYFQKYLP